MGLDTLSDREREVLDLALSGLTAREIAARLTLTEATIRSHLARIYAKFGVSGRVELMARLQQPAPGGAAESPEAPPEAAERPLPPARRRARALGALGLIAAVAVVVLVLAWQAAPPPETTLADFSEMVLSGKVQALDERGDTPYVTTTDNRQYRVEAIDEKLSGRSVWEWVQAMDPTAMNRVTFHVTMASDPLPVLFLLSTAVEVAAVILLALLGLATLRWILRSTPPRRQA